MPKREATDEADKEPAMTQIKKPQMAQMTADSVVNLDDRRAASEEIQRIAIVVQSW
jgi:hypothetical protein